MGHYDMVQVDFDLLKEYDPEGFEKFEDYYGAEPQIDTIVYKVVGDASSQEIAFQGGEVN